MVYVDFRMKLEQRLRKLQFKTVSTTPISASNERLPAASVKSKYSYSMVLLQLYLVRRPATSIILPAQFMEAVVNRPPFFQTPRVSERRIHGRSASTHAIEKFMNELQSVFEWCIRKFKA
jgi:hypothetical protein